MAHPSSKNRVRPLLVRSGARFECAGDGLCCTDIHGLGPLGRRELREVRELSPNATVYYDSIPGHCMRPGTDGVCVERDASGRCRLHVRHGARSKPVGCIRYPYGLVSTPAGGRVTTDHRCPCRTLGPRPPLDLADAERSLQNRGGRLEADLHVPARIALTVDRRVSYERYAAIEALLIERLERGERAEEVLAAERFPRLSVGGWRSCAGEFLDMRDGTAGGMASVWFGDALLGLLEGYRTPERGRPWVDSFARGAARAPVIDDPERLWNDWIADELWMFRWLGWDCTFDVARAELTTRLAIARSIHARLGERGVRTDQAAAEAIAIVELAGITSEWAYVVGTIVNDPSPAAPLALPPPRRDRPSHSAETTAKPPRVRDQAPRARR